MAPPIPQHAQAASEAPTEVKVRVVLLAICNGELWVALNGAGPEGHLPGVALEQGESLDQAALRALALDTGGSHRYIEQLYSVSSHELEAPVVTVAYLAIADPAEACESGPLGHWVSVNGELALPEIDRNVLDYALVRLRAKLGYTTIAFHLLPPRFSLSELQHVYETVLGQHFDKRNFRRRILSADMLAETDETRREGSHRPARLFRFRAAHDAETYLTPAWADAPHREPDEA
ncbi:MAG: hypothetical protein QM692_10135 [Thermomicrobiales bacterium]